MSSALRPPPPDVRAEVLPPPSRAERPFPAPAPKKLWGAGATLVFLSVLWVSVCWRLGTEWSVDEQYGYGWFVPIFALVLGLLRWETRPPPTPPDPAAVRRVFLTLGALGLAMLAPVRLFQDANPDWRLLGWLHTGVAAGLTLLVLWAAGGRAWLRHGAFPVGFFFVAVPWIKSIEEWTVQGLMRGIAVAAAEGMELLGVPAHVEGNLLRVSTGTVGVNEACSGVRSLQTSLMVGLLLGELNGLRPTRRVALVAAAAALALAANLVRALILVWLAARYGMAAAERGHDTAGYVILGAVFVGTLGLAALLRPRRPGAGDSPSPAARSDSSVGHALPIVWVVAALGWLAAVEIGVEGWYRWHERGFVPRVRWTVRWPVGAPGFREVAMDEHTRRILRFDEGRAVSWQPAELSATPGPDARGLLYFFRWKPGHNTALLANAHRPDVCLPATGWQQSADRGVRFYPVAPGLTLPFRHFEFTRPGSAGTAAHVFYCLWEDRARPMETVATNAAAANAAAGDLGRKPTLGSRAERWDAVRDGRRHLGQRVMELALLGPGTPATTVDAEAAFARLLAAGLVTPVGPGEG